MALWLIKIVVGPFQICNALQSHVIGILVRPHWEYASTCWNPHTKQNIYKIEAVQRRAARFSLNYYEYGPSANLTQRISQDLGWLSLQHRRCLADLSLFFKINYNKINISFPSVVIQSNRHPHKFQQLQTLHSDAYKYQFYARTIRIWNLLPVGIINSTSAETFKTATVKWITPLSFVKVASTNTWTLQ